MNLALAQASVTQKKIEDNMRLLFNPFVKGKGKDINSNEHYSYTFLLGNDISLLLILLW